MNIKLNQLLSRLPEIEFIDVFPSAGDESNIFGGAFFKTFEKTKERKIGLLKNYTLGINASDDLEDALKVYEDDIKFQVLDDINSFIAKKLMENNIIARCSGKLEFGARALGNRSIIANPMRLITVNKINKAIKKRDFWMPFAPIILKEKANEYLHIPNSLIEQGSPYMMFGFETKSSKRDGIVCAVHQADNTARAQFVDKYRYPDLHDILTKFEEMSKSAVLLNTSFNLHGFPIVANTKEAIDVLLKSELDGLVVDNYYISKR